MFALFKNVSTQIARVNAPALPALKTLVAANLNNSFLRNASSGKKKGDKKGKKGDKKGKKGDKKKGKTALILMAPGAEEMEVVITAAVLHRASVKVKIAGLCDNSPVKCLRKVVIVPSTCMEQVKCEKYDAIILPGGTAVKALGQSTVVGDMLKKQEKEKRIIAAICSGPLVLAAHDICLKKCLTSYPKFKDELKKKYNYVNDRNVVTDGILVTSRGPGTCFQFSLRLAEILVGHDKAKKVAKAMLVKMKKEC